MAGLLISPPGVQSHGASHGRGIYFSNKIARSLPYSSTTDPKGRRVLLLSEVERMAHCVLLCLCVF